MITHINYGMMLKAVKPERCMIKCFWRLFNCVLWYNRRWSLSWYC
jgi:hypothetical protein